MSNSFYVKVTNMLTKHVYTKVMSVKKIRETFPTAKLVHNAALCDGERKFELQEMPADAEFEYPATKLSINKIRFVFDMGKTFHMTYSRVGTDSKYMCTLVHEDTKVCEGLGTTKHEARVEVLKSLDREAKLLESLAATIRYMPVSEVG